MTGLTIPEVRVDYSTDSDGTWREEWAAEFDACMAEHDAEVRADERRRIADEITAGEAI